MVEKYETAFNWAAAEAVEILAKRDAVQFCSL
jgi:hypothetical protein